MMLGGKGPAERAAERRVMLMDAGLLSAASRDDAGGIGVRAFQGSE